MSGMLMFWLVLTVVALVLTAITRNAPFLLPGAGFGGAAAMAWSGVGLPYQIGLAVVLLAMGVLLAMRQTSVTDAPRREMGPSRLSGLGALSNFSAFSDESDEVQVDHWHTSDSTEVMFRNRLWKARLAKGAQARPGLYKVREVRDGKLILDEVID